MTSDSARQVVDVIRQLRQMHPDWRLGQLVANIAMAARGPTGSAVWDVEDAEFVAAAIEHLRFNQPDAQVPVTPSVVS